MNVPNLLRETALYVESLERENEALKALLSPPALLPIAEVPVRQVTGIDMDKEPE